MWTGKEPLVLHLVGCSLADLHLLEIIMEMYIKTIFETIFKHMQNGLWL